MNNAHMGQKSTREWHEHAERVKRIQALRKEGHVIYSGEQMRNLFRHWFGEKPIPFVTTQEKCHE